MGGTGWTLGESGNGEMMTMIGTVVTWNREEPTRYHGTGTAVVTNCVGRMETRLGRELDLGKRVEARLHVRLIPDAGASVVSPDGRSLDGGARLPSWSSSCTGKRH